MTTKRAILRSSKRGKKSTRNTAQIPFDFSPSKNQKTYSLRDIPTKGKTLKDKLRVLDSPELDKLLKPGERWAFKLNEGHSYELFSNSKLMKQKLETYKIIQYFKNKRGARANELIEDIKIIRVKGEKQADLRKYKKMKDAEVEKNTARRQREKAALRKAKSDQRKAEARARKSEARARKSEAALKKQTAELRKLRSQVSKKGKKGKKQTKRGKRK